MAIKKLLAKEPAPTPASEKLTLAKEPAPPTSEKLTDVEFVGYKVTHHMGAMAKHIEEFGFTMKQVALRPELAQVFAKLVKRFVDKLKMRRGTSG